MMFHVLASTSAFVLLLYTSAIPTAWAADTQLPWADVNIMVVTDVHSYVGGNRHGKEFANVGDLISLHERLMEEANEQGADLFLMMNGDFTDGTGLSSNPPVHLTPILQHIPYDAINTGNHELYHSETVDFFLEPQGFKSHWQGNFLSTNTVLKTTEKPHLGDRYTYLHGAGSGRSYLTFGFLYDFRDNCNNTIVLDVEDVIQQEWFVSVVQDTSKYDAIFVLAHMDAVNPLVYVILEAIRNIAGPTVPVQFLTGHTHRRAYADLDEYASSLEAGHYFDTVGWVSFKMQDNVAPDFDHVFIDTKRDFFAHIIGMQDYQTPQGAFVSRLIQDTQESLGLLRPVGCSPMEFKRDLSLEEHDSLWGLYIHKVIPFGFAHGNVSMIFVQSIGALRNNLPQGDLVVDDLMKVSPFGDHIMLVLESVKGSDLIKILGSSLTTKSTYLEALPEYAANMKYIVADGTYDLYTAAFDVPNIVQKIKAVLPVELPPPVEYVNSDGTAITTLEPWIDFVTKQWPCVAPASHGHGGNSFAAKLLPWWIGAVTAILVLSVWKCFMKESDETENVLGSVSIMYESEPLVKEQQSAPMAAKTMYDSVGEPE